ncbi:MAG TPA: hypothetical protein VHV09_07045 [Trebonia sp.]|jgi:hypothetical protein|nr:hypothetical protein [Trebonia sp.]
MRETARDLEQPDQRKVLAETSAALLAEEGESVPDWENVGPTIADEIETGAGGLLALAAADYQAYEALRLRAVRVYGHTDRVVCLLAGGLAAYLVLVAVVPRLMPSRVAGTGLALTPWILAVLAVALGIRLAWWLRKRAGLVRDLPRAYRHWEEALRDEVLLPFIVERRNKLNPQLLHDFIGEQYPLRLIEDVAPRRLVVTDAMTRVSATARNVRSGSIGVCGPRGVGKSTILQFFGAGPAAGDGGDLRLFVSAPVDYQPLEFIIHLFSQLCEKVPHGKADRSALALETSGHLEQLKYLRTYTTSWSASLSPRAFLALARGYSKQRSEQPVTLPELVETFRDYTGRVAAWHQSKRGGTGRVVIGIDEVDKIRDGDRAEAFLNDIKAVFGIPGCLFLVSLSEDALTGFAHQTPSIRTAFDSAFDELVPVGPMAYQHTEQMLFKRVTGVPRPFIALCHVLAGGLPRDLVRAARALIQATSGNGEKSLAEAARKLVHDELVSLRLSSIRQLAEKAAPGSLLEALHDDTWPGTTSGEYIDAARKVAVAARGTESDSVRQLCQDLVVSLSFYATALDLFTASGPELVDCLRRQDYGIVDELAAARYATRMNAGLAHGLLEQYRVRREERGRLPRVEEYVEEQASAVG